ncbi:MAG: LLM class F420-dependent oxidoreductase [Chloroflexi bacterium]|nr:LLM class F420-dependent oxidoreductase [Chloroflexota bacterium]
MKIGVVYPQTEFDPDPIVVRDFAQTVEDLGFTHILAYEHVLGVDPNRSGGWKGIYSIEDSFMEPFALFSFMAAVTERVEFATGILILPQRQTALVAKQAATLDRLCGGRLRLGIGVGWNEAEYIALDENFHTRGRRCEEQVQVLRKLWTESCVMFNGHWHSIPHMGLKPRPTQQPIPIWFGGHADVVLRRAARLGDGWLPTYSSAEDTEPSLEKLREYLDAEGRSWDEFGKEARVRFSEGNLDVLADEMKAWEQVGATHISLNTMRSQLSGLDEHLQAIRVFSESFLD